MDAAVASILPELDCIFASKLEQSTAQGASLSDMFLVYSQFSLARVKHHSTLCLTLGQ